VTSPTAASRNLGGKNPKKKLDQPFGFEPGASGTG
jgi:hypothetical protein